MLNTEFEGAMNIGKPANMTEEQFSSAWAMPIDAPFDAVMPDGQVVPMIGRRWLMHYMPNKEDIEAINEGRGIWLSISGVQLAPHSVFTLNEQGEGNF